MVIGRMPQDGSNSTTTTTTTVAPTTTTTVAPTTTTTVPAPTTTVPLNPANQPQIPTTLSGTGGPVYAGGIDPTYKAPDKSVFNNKSNPYSYKSNDWQMILTMPKEQILGFQTKLMQAFPGWKPGVLGRINDDKTITKVKDLISYINTDNTVKGADLMTALEYYAKNPLEVQAASQRAAVRLTNPIDLRKPFERGAQAAIGQKLAPEQTKQMGTQFAQMETDYQQGAATGAGGTVIQPPDPTAFAEEKARKLQPTAAKATEYSDYMGVLSELLQG
jgi:hypothetical protein